MINVDICPFCLSKKRIIIQEQKFSDIYNELINPELNKSTRNWFACLECEFIYRSPKLDEDEQTILYEKYRDVSFRSESPEDYFARITGYKNSESENYKKVSWIIKNIDPSLLQGKCKVLDVGCGGGVLLHKIKEMLPNIVTYGVEPNESYSSLARNKSRAEKIKTSYFNSKTFQEKFDIIVSSDVLEHVDNPEELINDIHTSLKTKGCFFLEIPSPTNFGELSNEHDIFNMAHHVFYTKKILMSYLLNIGFMNIKVEDFKYPSGVWKLRSIAYKI